MMLSVRLVHRLGQLDAAPDEPLAAFEMRVVDGARVEALGREQLERAIEPLFRAIYTLFDLGDARDGTLMDTLVWCFDKLGLPADDERRGRHAIIAAMIARAQLKLLLYLGFWPLLVCTLIFTSSTGPRTPA